jgi:hypothetical protein
METFYTCDACQRPRLESEIQLGGDAYPDSVFCYPATTCDKDGALAYCTRCEDAFPEDELTNGGEYAPDAMFCHDCNINRH